MSPYYTTSDNFALTPALLLALFGCAALLFDFLVFDEPSRRKVRPLLKIAIHPFQHAVRVIPKIKHDFLQHPPPSSV